MFLYKDGDYVDFVLRRVNGYVYIFVYTYFVFAQYFDLCPK